jgi:hypothetical protein
MTKVPVLGQPLSHLVRQPKRHTWIGMSHVVSLLRLRIRDYFAQHQRVQYGVLAEPIRAMDINACPFFDVLVQEVFGEHEGDVRNMGHLARSESELKKLGIDERTAHEFAEEAFSAFVETVGQTMPEVSFQNREGFSFAMTEYDLLVTRPY